MSLLFFLCNCDTFSEKGTDYYEAPWKEIVRRGEGFVLASLVSACLWKLRHVVFWDKSSFSAYRASSDMTTLVVILYYLSVAAPIFYIKPPKFGQGCHRRWKACVCCAGPLVIGTCETSTKYTWTVAWLWPLSILQVYVFTVGRRDSWDLIAHVATKFQQKGIM